MPFSCHQFKRLPFGVIVSQDIFQHKLYEIYRNIPNVTRVTDDRIVSGATEQEHDQEFVCMLKATQANNVSLNSEKLQFKKQQVNFYGHILTIKGISLAVDKAEAIKNISTPFNAKELLSLLGMVTFLNRFSPRIAALTGPLHELMKSVNSCIKWH